jgi:hypothetical protein
MVFLDYDDTLALVPIPEDPVIASRGCWWGALSPRIGGKLGPWQPVEER